MLDDTNSKAPRSGAASDNGRWQEVLPGEIQQPGGRFRMDQTSGQMFRWVEVGDSPLDRPLTITEFPDYAAQSKREHRVSLRGFVQRLRGTTAPTKDRLPWLKLAPFGDKRTAANSLRNNENVLAIYGIEGDCDDEVTTPEEAAERLRAANVAAVICTSPSHTDDKPRFRVLAVASTALSPDERYSLVCRLNGALGGCLAKELWTLSQSYYYGSVNSNPAHRVIVVEGRPIDEATEIAPIDKPTAKADKATAATPKPPRDPNAPRPAKPYTMRADEIEGYIREQTERVKNAVDKHDALKDSAHALGGLPGIDPEAAKKMLRAALAGNEVSDEVKSWELADRTIVECYANGAKRPITIEPAAIDLLTELPTEEPEPWWNPWEKPKPPAFPSECLPPVLREAVEDTARRLGTDPGATAMANLAAVSGAVDGRTGIQVRRHDPDWTENLRLWVLLVGDPSAKKTPVLNAAVKPLRQAEAEAAQKYQIAKQEWDATPKAERGREPTKPRYIVHDTTPEAVGVILADNPRGVLLHTDELAGFIGGLDRYTANQRGSSANRAFWLQAYNGGYFSVDRISRPSISVPNLSVDIVGGIQPDRLREMADLTTDGMLQRFLPVVMGDATPGEDTPPAASVAALREHMAKLVAMPARGLYLDEAGHRAREAIFARLDKMRQNADGAFGSFLGKGDASLMRLAMALHFADPASVEAGDGLLPAVAVDRAGVLLNYLIRHAAIVYGLLSGRSQEDNRALASFIIRWKRDDIRLHQIVSGVRCCRGCDERDNLRRISVFVAHGWLKETGHPKTWQIAPGLREHFAERAMSEQTRQTRHAT